MCLKYCYLRYYIILIQKTIFSEPEKVLFRFLYGMMALPASCRRQDGNFMLHILVIDAQGGGIGKQIIAGIRARKIPADITAVGTNTLATTAMLKAGADAAATGENAVIVGCRKADLIIGPIGIVIADSLYGEISPAMAAAVGRSDARRLLIPVNKCDNIIAGLSKDGNLGTYISDAVRIVAGMSMETAGAAPGELC